MNEIANNTNDLAVIFPEGKEVTIITPGGKPEKLHIMPLPFKKWKRGFKYIAEIAPLLGFDLFGGQMTLEQIQSTDAEALYNRAQELVTDNILDVPDASAPAAPAASVPDIDFKALYNGLNGEGGEKITEFMAFAIGKFQADGTTPDGSYFDDCYDEVVDVLAAVIEVNLNFFIQKLLPKIMTNIQGMASVATNVKQAVQR